MSPPNYENDSPIEIIITDNFFRIKLASNIKAINIFAVNGGKCAVNGMLQIQFFLQKLKPRTTNVEFTA